jgi:hypothetical protein
MTMDPTELQAHSAIVVEQVGTMLDYWTEKMEPMERLTVLTAVHAFLATEIVGVALEAGGRAADANVVSKAAKANQAFLDVILEPFSAGNDDRT